MTFTPYMTFNGSNLNSTFPNQGLLCYTDRIMERTKITAPNGSVEYTSWKWSEELVDYGFRGGINGSQGMPIPSKEKRWHYSERKYGKAADKK